MKIMNEGIGSKSTSERQLIQEYNLKSVLKFSCKNNLTCYHEVFRIKNKLFLIMTMAEGKTLNFYMNKNILYMNLERTRNVNGSTANTTK